MRGNDPLEWVSTSGRFFVAITRPMQPMGKVFTLADGKTIPMIEHVASAHLDILRHDLDVKNAVAGIRLTGGPRGGGAREDGVAAAGGFLRAQAVGRVEGGCSRDGGERGVVPRRFRLQHDHPVQVGQLLVLHV